MNEKEVKMLGREIKETLPDNTNQFTINAEGEIEISYKDSEEKLSTIETEIPLK